MTERERRADEAEKKADAILAEKGPGSAYLYALREVNGWSSGFYRIDGERPMELLPTKTAKSKKAKQESSLW